MDDVKTANRQIKVCFISLNAYPLFSRIEKGVQGGAEVDVYMLSTELARDEKFKVSVITGDFGQNEVEVFENVTIYKTKDLCSPVAAIMSIWRAMRRAEADIYFKKGASFITALVGLFCRVYHKALILRTSRDMECDGTYIRKNRLRGWAFLWTLKQAKAVLVQKASNQKQLEEITGVSARAIPNGHRIVEQFNQKREWILWAGRSAVIKRPELFVKLAKEMPSEQFVMICQQSKGDNKYNELVAEAKAVGNLRFIERVPFHEIGDFFQRAKMLVNTSKAEGFPNTFIQACTCGTPILSLNVNPDDFLNKYNCGLCGDDNWERFVKQAKELLDAGRQMEYGQNAKKYAKENHDIEKIVEQYKKLFISVQS